MIWKSMCSRGVIKENKLSFVLPFWRLQSSFHVPDLTFLIQSTYPQRHVQSSSLYYTTLPIYINILPTILTWFSLSFILHISTHFDPCYSLESWCWLNISRPPPLFGGGKLFIHLNVSFKSHIYRAEHSTASGSTSGDFGKSLAYQQISEGAAEATYLFVWPSSQLWDSVSTVTPASRNS